MQIKIYLVSILFVNAGAQEPKLLASSRYPRFPFPFRPLSAVYDGKDSIHIVGSLYEVPRSESHILRYNIHTDLIDVYRSEPNTCGARILQLNYDEALCFGKEIIKWEIKPPGSFTQAPGPLPSYLVLNGAVKLNQSSVLMFGGVGKFTEAIHVDVESLITSSLKIYPSTSKGIPYLGSKAIAKGNDAFFFSRNSVTKLDLRTFEFKIIANTTEFFEDPAVIYDDDEFVYVFGILTEAYPTEGIFRFSLRTYEFLYIPVNKLIAGKYSFMTIPPVMTFVPELNRIYMFGNWYRTRDVHWQYTIAEALDPGLLFIDLTPLKTPRRMTRTKYVSTTVSGFISSDLNTSGTTEEPDKNQSNKGNVAVAWILGPIIPLLILIIFGIILIIRYRNRVETRDATKKLEVPFEIIGEADNFTENVSEVQSTFTRNNSSLPISSKVWKSPQPLKLVSEEQIGAGAFASVYKAKHSLLPSVYFAIKKISLYNALKHLQWNLAKVLREVESLTEITNPNVVKMFNCWLEDPSGNILKNNAIETLQFHEWSSTQNYFVFVQMEFCDSNLRDWLIVHDSIAQRLLQDIGNIITQTINGLKGIHERGIIHRDIKPTNIFHCHGGDLWKIGDLGLSTKFTESVEDKSIVGCASYRSPEMERGSKYNYKTDVFSLGLTFLETFRIFKSEFTKMNMFDSIRNRKEDNPQSVCEMANIKTMSPELLELLEKMLDVNSTKRINLLDCTIENFCKT